MFDFLFNCPDDDDLDSDGWALACAVATEPAALMLAIQIKQLEESSQA
jgi:hypothetical protein